MNNQRNYWPKYTAETYPWTRWWWFGCAVDKPTITRLLETGELFRDLEMPPLDKATDRVMICGSMGLNMDLKAILEKKGFREGSHSEPAEYVLEKAFVG